MRVSWLKSKRSLATLWFTGAGIIFFIMLLQTILGRYETNAEQAWGWFSTTILPTLSLIIGVLVRDTMGNEPRIQTVDRFLFRLSFSLSLAYLIVVLSTILMQPFSTISIFELMKQSNLWLGPFQGLVTASLGAFFIQKGKE